MNNIHELARDQLGETPFIEEPFPSGQGYINVRRHFRQRLDVLVGYGLLEEDWFVSLHRAPYSSGCARSKVTMGMQHDLDIIANGIPQLLDDCYASRTLYFCV